MCSGSEQADGGRAGGVRAAYNKHFMHGARAAGGGSGGYVGTYFP